MGRRGLRERVTTALRGIADEQGIGWASVEAALAEPLSAERRARRVGP